MGQKRHMKGGYASTFRDSFRAIDQVNNGRNDVRIRSQMSNRTFKEKVGLLDQPMPPAGFDPIDRRQWKMGLQLNHRPSER